MTNPNKTHITFVIDRSGSMASVKGEAQSAINAFIAEQKEVGGECTILLSDFDSGPSNFRVVQEGSLDSTVEYVLQPRGMTALWDAVGRAIQMTGHRLEALPEDSRPGKVVFVVQTDGGENASREFSLAQINKMIKEQTDKYAWEFVYLGMGLDTVDQGYAMGISNVAAASGSAQSYGRTFDILSANMTSYRGGGVKGMSAMNTVISDEDDDDGEKAPSANLAP